MTKATRVLLLTLLAGCATMHRRPPAPPPDALPFILTFWCGPPLAEFDDARAAEIAAAGFNFVGATCEGTADHDSRLRALAVAARHGLRLIVSDPRFNAHAPEQDGWESRLAAAAADYRAQPGFGAYFIDDEPSAPEFQEVAAVVDGLRAADPAHFAYVNLLPDYVLPKGLGTDTYDDYIEQFVTTVQPALLSYDYYPFGKKKDRSTFFTNLAAVRGYAMRADIPFMLIVQVMPHGPYRDPTEAEIAWQVFHALAFGARGISYFAYWTPPDGEGDNKWNFRYGVIEHGKPTLHYFQIARLNHKVRAIAQQLSPFTSLVVADATGEIGAAFPIGPIEKIDGGPITAGLFMDDAGRLAALLVNRDYRYGVTAVLQLRPGARLPQAFDAATGIWAQAGASFRLAPGDAQLIRWGGP